MDKKIDNRVTGFTKLFGSVGDPVKYSISPEMHNTLFTEKGLNNLHMPIRVPKGQLADFIEMFKLNYTGLSVTKPHKQDMIPFIDEIDADVKRLNAVNCIRIVDGKMYGYNTDCYGFSKSLALHEINVKGKKILLAGVGGAAGIVANELMKAEAILTIANRTVKKAQELMFNLKKHWPDACIDAIAIDDIQAGYDGIINATPVGMKPFEEQCIFTPDQLTGAEFCFDLIYNPAETTFLKMAKEAGVSKCVNGFDMLFYQGVKAQELWTGVGLSYEKEQEIRNACEAYLHTL